MIAIFQYGSVRDFLKKEEGKRKVDESIDQYSSVTNFLGIYLCNLKSSSNGSILYEFWSYLNRIVLYFRFELIQLSSWNCLMLLGSEDSAL